METQLLTAVIAASAALIGALGSQKLTARATQRARQFELWWAAKASAYKICLEGLGEFASSPTDHGKYLTFLAAYQTALLFASDEVAQRLRGPTGISVNAQRLRLAPTDERRSSINFTYWYEAAEAVSSAM
jgi:hypothetical protein